MVASLRDTLVLLHLSILCSSLANNFSFPLMQWLEVPWVAGGLHSQQSRD